MRQTTKITIGVLAAFILLSILYIFFLSTLEPEGKEKIKTEIRQTFGQTEVKPYKVALIKAKAIGKDELSAVLYGDLHFINDTSGRYKIEYPEEVLPYLAFQPEGDTLKVIVDQVALAEAFHLKSNGRFSPMRGFNLKFTTDSSLQVINEMPCLEIRFDKQTFGNLDIKTSQGVKIGNCTIRDLTVRSGCRSFEAAGSTIQTLNLDLDDNEKWRIKDCQVETENLTGGQTHYIELSKEECRRMNWIPKNEKAQLSIQLKKGEAFGMEFKE